MSQKGNFTFSPELLEEVNASIIKNLPEQVGNILKELLIKGEKDSIELERVCSNYDKLSKEFELKKKELNEYICEVTNINAHAEKLVELEKSLIKRELFLDKEILKIKLEESEKRSTEAVDIVRIVFKSPVYMKTIQEQIQGNTDYINGQSVFKQTGKSIIEQEQNI